MPKQISLVGRKAILNFPQYNREGPMARGRPMPEFFKDCLGTRAGLARYADQEVTITNERFADDGHELAIETADGVIQRVYSFDLTLLPAPAPTVPAWEYLSVPWGTEFKELGEQGWELVAFAGGSVGVFKRPLHVPAPKHQRKVKS